HLSEDDWLALTRHTADAGSLLERAVLNDVEKLAQVLEEDTRNTIGWMVYDGLLQFKIAVPAAGNRHTDFHSKFGIFLLEGSPVVAFIGSLNESERAFENHEVVSVFHRQDRESTRLNSSHVKISYAVFCLKKKKNKYNNTLVEQNER